MSEAVQDGYERYYGDKLWNLLPAAYRVADSEIFDAAGPLRELLARIGASMAVVRRGIDRLWEDQSIETCDSWVIPYLAELLATNLVPSMDARGQRLDVANTIYYRRRKWTVALLEQLAHDVTGYEARVIEFFRQLARNRHGLDAGLGRPADAADPAGARTLQRAEQLTGLLTGTPAGGWADLRNPLGAALTGGAYDEYHHRVDVRPGRAADPAVHPGPARRQRLRRELGSCRGVAAADAADHAAVGGRVTCRAARSGSDRLPRPECLAVARRPVGVC